MGRKVRTSPEGSRIAGLLHHQAVTLHSEGLSDSRLAVSRLGEALTILSKILAEQQRQIRYTGAFPNDRKDDALGRHILFDLQPGNRDRVNRIAVDATAAKLSPHHGLITSDRRSRLPQGCPGRRQHRSRRQGHERSRSKQDFHLVYRSFFHLTVSRLASDTLLLGLSHCRNRTLCGEW